MLIIIFIFADEASECGDYRDTSSTINTSRKHRDWAAQVESEQQEETGYSTDSMIHSAALIRGAAGRGGRRGWRRGRPPLPTREGVLMINNLLFLFAFSTYLLHIYLYLNAHTHNKIMHRMYVDK
jgi:hypothetical protein